MNLAKILQTLREEPLLIAPGAHAALVKLFDDHRALSHGEFSKREGSGNCGQTVEVAQAEVDENGIMHIPIGGPVGIGFGSFEKGAGAVDLSDVCDELKEAEENADVMEVLLDVDSPGGMVQGTPECADVILAMSKPVYAFTAGQMCSAAYWVGCSTKQIFATRTANIGSIGVYIPWADYTEYFKQNGVSVELFTSGKFKGMGYPGTSLTKAQKELLQERVSSIAEMFYSHVRMQRSDSVDDDSMQGQTFMGEEALNRMLIDAVVRDKSEAVANILGNRRAGAISMR